MVQGESISVDLGVWGDFEVYRLKDYILRYVDKCRVVVLNCCFLGYVEYIDVFCLVIRV